MTTRSMDARSMDGDTASSGETTTPTLYFLRIENGELYLREESHEVRDDLDQYVNFGLEQVKLDGETFTVTVE